MIISSIDLTEEERWLNDTIRWVFAGGNEFPHADPRELYKHNKPLTVALFRSIHERKAIPDIRWRYFADPRLNAGLGKKSHLQVFEGNGCRGQKILEDLNFHKYLWYFIHGARLPEEVKQKVVAVIGHAYLEEHEWANKIGRICRQAVRSHSIRPRQYSIAEEFYKLALDCELEIWVAKSIRSHVMRVEREFH